MALGLHLDNIYTKRKVFLVQYSNWESGLVGHVLPTEFKTLPDAVAHALEIVRYIGKNGRTASLNCQVFEVQVKGDGWQRQREVWDCVSETRLREVFNGGVSDDAQTVQKYLKNYAKQALEMGCTEEQAYATPQQDVLIA